MRQGGVMTTSAGPVAEGDERRLRLPDAVGTGLASSIGAGLFVALGPAAASAGDLSLIHI